MLKWYPASHLEIKEVKKFIFIFYLVGITGFAIPFLNPVFRTITPLALLLSVYLLAIYHNEYSKKTLIAFGLIYLLGFAIEMIGVKTGAIFGFYSYGSTLGPKILETPLIIGINWLFLIYAISSLTEKLKAPASIQVFVASALMVIYDLVMEHVAPKMDMWHWEDDVIPYQNYIAWFFIGALFFSLLKICRVNTHNPFAFILLAAQFLFFIFLLIFL